MGRGGDGSCGTWFMRLWQLMCDYGYGYGHGIWYFCHEHWISPSFVTAADSFPFLFL